MRNLIETYNDTQECHYKNEYYSVRDNGAVLRHPPKDKRPRPSDNEWTFGKLSKSNGYLEIASERVHRIVATAFHGQPPTKEHVVDHIDTNKQNNRPENLRWVTKLENILLNPITARRIEIVCGSIEVFLSDPSKFRNKFQDPNYEWMCAVSIIEAQNSKERLLDWAKSKKPSKGGTLGEWIFQTNNFHDLEKIEDIFNNVEKRTGISKDDLCSNKHMRGDFYEARKFAAKMFQAELNLTDYEIGKIMGLSQTTVNLYLEISPDRYSGDYKEVREREFNKRLELTTQNYVQKNWHTKSEFSYCPHQVLNDPIADYGVNLKSGELFFKNPFYYTTHIQSSIIDSGNSLLVLYSITKSDNDVQRWGIMKITYESEKFVYEIIPNYNGTLEHYWLIDAENHFTSIIEGSKWTPMYDSQGKEFKGDYLPL